jgi:UDP-GlcNAc3NAcA epimerase
VLRILTVVGARPQFVKAAVISRVLRESYAGAAEEYLVHTGQHYDENMSEVFFRQMRIPKPDINLEIGSATHGAMTGRMLEKIEALLLEKKPDAVLVYGDTNSTLAGALAASKLHIPLAHVEAGLRSFNKRMPEEQNRVLTDHLSSFLFCPTETALENLEKEGIEEGVHRTGDIMLDASLFYRSLPHELSLDLPDSFFLVTLHRAENTDDQARLSSIVRALNEFSELPALLPLHPRTKKMMDSFGLSFASHIRTIDPVGYLDMLAMEDRCRFIVTDSGGVQKEAYFFHKPCITLRDQTEWTETVEAGANAVVGADYRSILDVLDSPPNPSDWDDLYGHGEAGKQVIDTLVEVL